MQGKKKKKTLAMMETISNADLLFVLYCTSSANSIPPPSHHSRPCRRYSLPMQVIYSQYSSSRRHPVASAIRLPHHPHRQMKLPSSSSCSRASPPPLASLLYNTPNTPYNVSSLSECLEAASGSPPPLHHLADSPESLNHAWWPVSPCTTHWPPPCSSERVSTDCWFRQSGSLHHNLRRLSQSRVGSRACYSVKLPALQQDSRHHPS